MELRNREEEKEFTHYPGLALYDVWGQLLNRRTEKADGC